MKRKSKVELGITILSIIMAFVVWLAVMGFGDPKVPRRIGGIKVTMVNASAIEDLDKIYMVKNESDVISINIRDKRSIVDSLSADDFVAKADLSKWNELGNVPIVVSCKNGRVSSDSYVQSSYSLQLEIEDLVTKVFPINVDLEGEAAVGYTAESAVASPESVVVKGGETLVNSIDKIVAHVDITGMSRDLDVKVPLTAYGIDNREVDSDDIRYNSLPRDEKLVDVTVHILKTNKIPIEIKTTGKLPDGYIVESIECKPDKIEVKGNTNKIKNTKKISVRDSLLNLDGVIDSFTKAIDISKHLPAGISLANENDMNISVKVNIKQLNNIIYDIPFSDISLKNVPKDFNFEIMGTGVATVIIYGKAEKLITLTPDSLYPVVDLRNCIEEKTYQLPVQITLPEGCYGASENKVFVRLYKGEGNTEHEQETHDENTENIVNDNSEGTESGDNKPNN